MSEPLILSWADFRGGEVGKFGIDSPPEKNMFAGKNVLVYSNGLLGPRPGAKALPVHASLPTGKLVVFGLSDTGSDGSSRAVMALVDDAADQLHVGQVSLTAGASWNNGVTIAFTEAGSTRGTSDTAAGQGWGNNFVSVNGNLYQRQLSASLNLRHSATGFKKCVVVYDDRVACVDSDVDNKVYFSDRNNVASWPATNFFLVGDSAPVTGLFSYGDRLIIVKANEVWVHAGPLGSSSSRLAQVDFGASGTYFQDQAVHTPEGVWMAGSFGPPALFDGAGPQIQHHLVPILSRTNSDQVSHGRWRFGAAACPGGTDQRTLLFNYGITGADHRMIVRHNGVWTYHDPGGLHSADFSGAVVGTPYTDQGFMFAKSNGDGQQPNFYWLQLSGDKPGAASAALSQPGDGTTVPLSAHVHLPVHWTEHGQEARIRQVVVDYVSWNTGASQDNELTCEAVTRSIRGTADEHVRSGTWTSPVGSSSTTGTTRRHVFDFGTSPYGAGVQVRFPSLKGVAIRQVKAVVDVQEGRPRR